MFDFENESVDEDDSNKVNEVTDKVESTEDNTKVEENKTDLNTEIVENEKDRQKEVLEALYGNVECGENADQDQNNQE